MLNAFTAINSIEKFKALDLPLLQYSTMDIYQNENVKDVDATNK